jgi:hypothetical protein
VFAVSAWTREETGATLTPKPTRYSRPGNDFTRRFPLIVQAISALKARSCVIDVEAIAYDDDGIAGRHDQLVDYAPSIRSNSTGAICRREEIVRRASPPIRQRLDTPRFLQSRNARRGQRVSVSDDPEGRR